LSVIDTGPGIRPEVLPRIFEPLYTTKNFGVGLGLPTVRQIVELHGGSINVDSAPAVGTTVTVRLPLLGAVPSPAEVAAAQSHNRPPIVDDGPGLAEAVGTRMRRQLLRGSMTSETTMTGGCSCGAVRYSAAGAPKWASHCHCRDCRRAAGAPYVTYAGFAT